MLTDVKPYAATYEELVLGESSLLSKLCTCLWLGVFPQFLGTVIGLLAQLEKTKFNLQGEFSQLFWLLRPCWYSFVIHFFRELNLFVYCWFAKHIFNFTHSLLLTAFYPHLYPIFSTWTMHHHSSGCTPCSWPNSLCSYIDFFFSSEIQPAVHVK